MAKVDLLLRLMADYHNFEHRQELETSKTDSSNDELFEDDLDFVSAAGTTMDNPFIKNKSTDKK